MSTSEGGIPLNVLAHGFKLPKRAIYRGGGGSSSRHHEAIHLSCESQKPLETVHRFYQELYKAVNWHPTLSIFHTDAYHEHWKLEREAEGWDGFLSLIRREKTTGISQYSLVFIAQKIEPPTGDL